MEKIDEDNFADFQMTFGVQSEGYSRTLLDMQEYRTKMLFETLRALQSKRQPDKKKSKGFFDKKPKK